jgi:hypothetical protein
VQQIQSQHTELLSRDGGAHTCRSLWPAHSYVDMIPRITGKRYGQLNILSSTARTHNMSLDKASWMAAVNGPKKNVSVAQKQECVLGLGFRV